MPPSLLRLEWALVPFWQRLARAREASWKAQRG